MGFFAFYVERHNNDLTISRKHVYTSRLCVGQSRRVSAYAGWPRLMQAG